MAQYVLGERAAEAVRQLMAGDSSVGRVKATVPTPVDPVEFPAPWYIEYSSSEDNGNGSWVIWLPAESFKSEKSAYETAFTTMRNGMTACTSRPAGWYRFRRNLSSGGEMYLTIDESSSSGTPTMAIEDDVSQDVMIPIAWVDRDTTTGIANPPTTVKQHLVGTLVYGGVGDGVTDDRDFVKQLRVVTTTGTTEGEIFRTTDNIDVKDGLVQGFANPAPAEESIGSVYMGIEKTPTVVTGISYDSTTREIKVAKGTKTIHHGHVKAWSDDTESTLCTLPATATGLTKTFQIIYGVGYDSSTHELWYKSASLEFVNGILQSFTDGGQATYHTAVPETI